MRRREREIRNPETIKALLEKPQVGRMATVNRKGFPVIKPVNFLYWDGKIYIHSSTKGEKIADIRRGSPVCFEVDDPVAYVTARGPACTSSYYYRSIIIKGRANLIGPRKKKLEVFEKMMEKYQPEGGYGEVSLEILAKTAIIEISVEEMTGKENLG
jgi:uncharacterized protein